MIKLSPFVAISNGSPVTDVYISGQYKNGMKYHIVNDKTPWKEVAVIVFETPALVYGSRKTDLLEAIEEGRLNVWPLQNYSGYDLLGQLKKDIIKELDSLKKKAVFNAMVTNLDLKYPELDDDIKNMVKNLDWYSDYSNDEKVRQQARQNHERVMGVLKAVNASGYYLEYENIVHG